MEEHLQEIEVKDTKVQLIVEPGYKIEHLCKFIQESCLSQKCSNITKPDSENLKLICENLEHILNEDLTFEEVIACFVASSMNLFLGERAHNFEQRFYLLNKSFSYMNTLHPVHLHVAAKFMFNQLKSIEDPHYNFNILKICHHISKSSETGMAISICLLWAMLYDITETEIVFFRFYEISHLPHLLKDVVSNLKMKDENAPKVFLIVRIVEFLIETIVFDDKHSIASAGYTQYFEYNTEDLKTLLNWANDEFDVIKLSKEESSPNLKLWLATIDLVKISILTQLKAKLQGATSENTMDT